MFTLRESDLKRILKINHMTLPDDDMVFFGLRGCLPADPDEHSFHSQHDLTVTSVSYRTPACTLGQWKPGKGFAVFPGSTVPHHRHVSASVARNGRGTNQLMTGFFRDYRKGTHKSGKPTGHEAFRQNNKLPIRRTADDLDYDADDRVEFMVPFDNLHAAWCMGVDHDRFASAGCQVVVGFPKCKKRGAKPDVGPWKVFKENAYKLTQDSFYYLLVTGIEAQTIALDPTKKRPSKLRFGSKGALVTNVQNALNAAGFSVGTADGDFGSRTLFGVLEFQEAEFGDNADDGIVGPLTASALGVRWPKV